MSNMCYLLLPKLSIQKATIFQPDIISGAMMPTALAGFAHKFGIDLTIRLGEPVRTTGVALVVHDYREHDGQARFPAPGPKAENAPDAFDLRADLVVSLVLELECAEESRSEIATAARSLCIAASLAGGKVFTEKNATYGVYSNQNEVLRALGNGAVLFDRAEMLADRIEETRSDPLDALLDLIEFVPVHTDDDGRVTWGRRRPGWIVPVVVGYQAINAPVVRPGTRANDRSTPHVYAESVYSLAEYRSLSAILHENDDEPLDGAIWRYKHVVNSSTFHVSAI